MENNRMILGRLRDEYEKLQIRQQQLEMNGKKTVEQTIHDVKDIINRIKQ
jgi:hypothetical protein